MRTLGKLKLIAVSAALVLGMSSCLKNDKKFAIYASPAYILQEGNRYQLQIQVQGNEQICTVLLILPLRRLPELQSTLLR